MEVRGDLNFLSVTKQQVTPGSIAAAMRELLSSVDTVKVLSQACAELVDGHGLARVERSLDAEAIVLRKAGRHDRDSIFEWRNAEETRRHSHSGAPTGRNEHERWFSQTLADGDRVLLVGERAGGPVGVLRYDCAGPRCTVSIYLVPGQYRRGHGTRLLLAGHDWLRRHRPEVREIVADVSLLNLPSVEAFRQAGYSRDAQYFLKTI